MVAGGESALDAAEARPADGETVAPSGEARDVREVRVRVEELEPGAVVPLHEHTAIEQTWVLEGRFIDEEGECLPGQFVWRPSGNTHVAWAGPEGATILGVFLKPNVFADGRKFFTEEKAD